MQIFLQLVASGVAVGMIYAAIAFGYQLTFATSKTEAFSLTRTTPAFLASSSLA
jgi:branched-subunit amino acid ABC-type transport system permease component